MTLAELLPQATFVIVTTPQPAAQRVARRSAEMAHKVSLEISGVIENMAGFVTPDGERFAIFGEGGGQSLADELDVPLLGKVPLTMPLRAAVRRRRAAGARGPRRPRRAGDPPRRARADRARAATPTAASRRRRSGWRCRWQASSRGALSVGRRLAFGTLGGLIAALALPAVASAHGIQLTTDLPIPEWLFAWAAAVVLVVSFVALATLWPAPRLAALRERDWWRYPRWLEPLCGAVGVGLFVVVVYAGIAGAQLPYSNLAPTWIYVVVLGRPGVPLGARSATSSGPSTRGARSRAPPPGSRARVRGGDRRPRAAALPGVARALAGGGRDPRASPGSSSCSSHDGARRAQHAGLPRARLRVGAADRHEPLRDRDLERSRRRLRRLLRALRD